jgi:hypothetical protein
MTAFRKRHPGRDEGWPGQGVGLIGVRRQRLGCFASPKDAGRRDEAARARCQTKNLCRGAVKRLGASAGLQ